MRRCRVLASLCLLAAPLASQEATRRFQNQNGTFHLTLPADWRQLAPGEARTIADDPRAPAALRLAQPRSFYAVGPVDRWLAGDFAGPWLYVVEGEHEWYVTDTFAEDLAAMWRQWEAATGERHAVQDVRRERVGSQQVEVVTAIGLSPPANGRPAVQSLDVHAPAVGRQITLQFCCAPEDFPAQQPTFRTWLASLTFARVPKGQQSLGDRLWTPLLTGGVVAIVLLLLYKHTARRR